METKTSRRIFWLAAILLVPFPVFVFGPGLVPAGRFFMLSGLGAAFAVLESSGGTVLAVTGSLLAHAVVYSALLWPVAWLLARALKPLAPITRLRATIFVVLFGAAFAATNPIYHTPFSEDTARATLLGLYR